MFSGYDEQRRDETIIFALPEAMEPCLVFSVCASGEMFSSSSVFTIGKMMVPRDREAKLPKCDIAPANVLLE